MTPLRNKDGFTLLELILAMAIVGMIVASAMGGLRLGILAQEAGESKLDQRQRLRVITTQLAQKIKSAYPVFILPESSAVGTNSRIVKNTAGVLAFEGGKDFIRFITFAGTLSGTGESPWPHEVHFYVGRDPVTGRHGLVMMERDLESESPFSFIPAHSGSASYHLLAEHVKYLEFRYYMIDSKAIADQAESGSEFLEPVIGEWVDSVLFHAPDPDQQARGNRSTEGPPITLPRGIEVYVGLAEPSDDDMKEPEIHRSFPLILPLHTGMKFAAPILLEEETDAGA